MKTYLSLAFIGVACSLASCEKKEAAASGSASSPETAVADSSDTYVLANNSLLPSTEKTMTTSTDVELTDATMTLTMGENQMDGSMTNETETEETFQLLSENTLRYELLKDIDTGVMVMNGQEQATPTKSNALIGVPVIVEVKDGTVTAKLEEGTPSAAQETELEKIVKKFETNDDYVMYGDTPRSIGDRWDVDVSKLPDFGGATGLSGTFNVHLKSVEEVDGVKCAILECVLDLSGKAPSEEGGPEMTMTIKGTADVIRSLDDLEDLSVKMAFDMVMKGQAGPGMDMSINGSAVMTEKTELK